jgi:hypothetical protein
MSPSKLADERAEVEVNYFSSMKIICQAQDMGE